MPAAIGEELVITAVDKTNKTLTVTGTVSGTVSGSHFVFRHGAGGASGGVGQKEITGLQTIVNSSGTLFNVDPTVDPEWVSEVDSAASNRAACD